MSDGLCIEPTTFMLFINDVLYPFLDLFLIAHLDNILVIELARRKYITSQLGFRNLKKHPLLEILKTLQQIPMISSLFCF